MDKAKFAAIKRSTDNDNHDGSDETYRILTFDDREAAIVWLLEQYEHWENNSGFDREQGEWGRGVPDWNILRDFFRESKNEDALFHWQWKRRNNFRTYRIVQFTGDLNFSAKAGNLFKYKNRQVIPKPKKAR